MGSNHETKNHFDSGKLDELEKEMITRNEEEKEKKGERGIG